jgi:nifR3 family TIM-barrel protein
METNLDSSLLPSPFSLYSPVSIGSLVLPGNLFLAPVAGYSDRAFRSLCAEQGAVFTSTELVSAEALSRNPGRYGLGGEGTAAQLVPAAFSLVRRGDSEKQYAVQLFGSDPERMAMAAALLAPLQPDAVDINSGCPVPKVVKTGAGSALMKNPALLGKMVEAVVRSSREHLGGVPVTVKMRSGWDHSSINYNECARIAVEAGAAMVSLHPRTRSQGYGGKSDWSCIEDLASRLSVPVTGSGDLYTPEDAERMLRETRCAAVMFARGAEGNPFIFSETRALLENGARRQIYPTMAERLALALRHLELLSADIGERTACLEMRKQFCAYTKGRGGHGQDGQSQDGPAQPGIGALRNALVQANTIEDYRKILEPYLTR